MQLSIIPARIVAAARRVSTFARAARRDWEPSLLSLGCGTNRGAAGQIAARAASEVSAVLTDVPVDAKATVLSWMTGWIGPAAPLSSVHAAWVGLALTLHDARAGSVGLFL
jgi:hypothetical protein